MSTQIVLPAEEREGVGTGPARALRRQEKVPGIVYGGKGAPLKIAVPFRAVQREINNNPRFFSSVIELDFGGRKRKLRVLAREAQLHPVTDVPLHVDFLRAERGAELTVEIPVVFVHEDQSVGLKRGGVLNIVRREVELVCPAEAIPESLTVDLAGFDIGDSIHFSHIELPDRVRPTITDRDFTIASIVPPTLAIEEEEEAEAAEAEAAEGEGEAEGEGAEDEESREKE